MDHGAHSKTFSVTVVSREGGRMRAKVQLAQTVPPGGLELDVLWDIARSEPIAVTPYRNLGVFVTAELARQAGGPAPH